jgi:hypothetical protein
MTSEVVEGVIQASKKFVDRRYRAEAHRARRHARGSHADHARTRRQSVARDGFGGSEQQGAGAVVEAGGVTCGDGRVGAEQRRQRGECVERRVGARLFVGNAVADRQDLVDEMPGRDRARCALLRAQRERVLVGPRDVLFAGEMFGRLRH